MWCTSFEIYALTQDSEFLQRPKKGRNPSSSFKAPEQQLQHWIMHCCPIWDGFSLRREAVGRWKRKEKTDAYNHLIESLGLFSQVTQLFPKLIKKVVNNSSMRKISLRWLPKILQVLCWIAQNLGKIWCYDMRCLEVKLNKTQITLSKGGKFKVHIKESWGRFLHLQ